MSPTDEAAVRLRRLLRDLHADVAALQARATEIDDHRAKVGSPENAAMMAVALHHYYTAFESALERAVRFLDGDIPSGPDWHRALLVEASKPVPEVRPTLVSPGALNDWRELLRFRHFFRHAYAVVLEWDHLLRHGKRVVRLHALCMADLQRLIEHLEQALATLEAGEGEVDRR